MGYFLEDRVTDTGQFIDAVRRVAAGGTVRDPQVTGRLLARGEAPGTISALVYHAPHCCSPWRGRRSCC
ncbi:hypothetical protein [Streptomyces collinus]|uniref:hypothetical protein n=1 Tax=Streptomyces collinus TaxID=42684 RepID=UPI001062850B